MHHSDTACLTCYTTPIIQPPKPVADYPQGSPKKRLLSVIAGIAPTTRRVLSFGSSIKERRLA